MIAFLKYIETFFRGVSCLVKRSVGISFIAISTILIAFNYFSEAISGRPIEDTLSNFSLLLLLTGMCYLAWGEYDEYKSGKRNTGK